MDGYDAVLAFGTEYRFYGISLPLLRHWLCHWSLYLVPGKGVDGNVKTDRPGFGCWFGKIWLLCHGIRDPCGRSGGTADLWCS